MCHNYNVFFFNYIPCVTTFHLLSLKPRFSRYKVDHLYYVDFEGPMPRCCEAAGGSDWSFLQGPLALFPCSIMLQTWPRSKKREGNFHGVFFLTEMCISIISRSLVIDEISIDSYLEPLKYHTRFDHFYAFWWCPFRILR